MFLALLTSIHFWAPLLALGGAAWIAWRQPRFLEGKGAVSDVLFSQFLLVVGLIAFYQLFLAAILLSYPDAELYQTQTEEIAAAWSAGEFPGLSGEEWIGSLHTGFQRATAAWMILTAPLVEAAPAVGALGPAYWVSLFAALLNIVLFRVLALIVFAPVDPDDRRHSLALFLFVVWPTHTTWLVSGLREPLLLTALLTALLPIVVLLRRLADDPSGPSPTPARWLTLPTIAALFWLATFRVYLAGAIAFALCVVLLTRMPRRLRLTTIAGAALLGAVVVLASPLRSSIGPLIRSVLDVAGEQGGGLGIMLSPVRLVLGPYAWVLVDEFTADYLLYAGQWMVYLVFLPALLAAMMERWRGHRRDTDSRLLGPLEQFAAIAVALYAIPLCIVYQGHAFRAWYPIIVLYALVAPAGLAQLRKRPRLCLIWLAGLGVAIALQATLRALISSP